ncbi:nuclear pore complex protein Nup214 [Trichonephila clavipes]|nr:nuclear pore complex protein Nup214 [Trichonephila clavipes]
MVERFNRTILNNLSLMVSKNQQDWDQKVPLFLLAYCSAVHETTGYSPSQMLFGRDLRLPCDLLFGRPPDTPSSPEEYVQNLQARFEDVHNLARERINLRTEKMKTRYDTKATGHQFKEGDKVWFYNPTRRKGLSPKLQSHWDGPYTILKIINDVVIRILANICWLSTAQFAVLYMPEGKNVSPYLFIVSTPKGAPVVYINYYDICLGNATNELQRYMLHHEATWDLLICASTDSIEVAVLGDPPSWVQWDLRDDGRILLPAKNGAKCAVGMGVMFCSQRRIVINENESYPAMPIIFILTDNGLLVSYHMVNTAPGCASLVRPSTPIEREGERKRPGGTQNVNQTVPSSQSVPKILDANSINTAPSFFQSPAPGSVSSFPFNAGKPSSLSLSQASTQPDSRSALKVRGNSQLTQDIIALINRVVAAQRTCTLQWILPHVDTFGNELSDNLVKETQNSPQLSNSLTVKKTQKNFNTKYN